MASSRFIAFILAPALMTGACGAKEAPSEGPVVTVDVAPVLSAQIERRVRGDALLFPFQQAAIIPKITAPVAKTYVERGARVRAGQLLVALESKDLANAARESQASPARLPAGARRSSSTSTRKPRSTPWACRWRRRSRTGRPGWRSRWS